MKTLAMMTLLLASACRNVTLAEDQLRRSGHAKIICERDQLFARCVADGVAYLCAIDYKLREAQCVRMPTTCVENAEQ